jgi:hypothetical protein
MKRNIKEIMLNKVEIIFKIMKSGCLQEASAFHYSNKFQQI